MCSVHVIVGQGKYGVRCYHMKGGPRGCTFSRWVLSVELPVCV